ncbi:hypothetical protein H9P43_005866 [Blastocladiella emersonii ATCC 22665]|nr:hypothetical protein H9P43_005866 [Blastocladiella emersonii ATCC 22665]
MDTPPPPPALLRKRPPPPPPPQPLRARVASLVLRPMQHPLVAVAVTVLPPVLGVWGAMPQVADAVLLALTAVYLYLLIQVPWELYIRFDTRARTRAAQLAAASAAAVSHASRSEASGDAKHAAADAHHARHHHHGAAVPVHASASCTIQATLTLTPPAGTDAWLARVFLAAAVAAPLAGALLLSVVKARLRAAATAGAAATGGPAWLPLDLLDPLHFAMAASIRPLFHLAGSASDAHALAATAAAFAPMTAVASSASASSPPLVRPGSRRRAARTAVPRASPRPTRVASPLNASATAASPTWADPIPPFDDEDDEDDASASDTNDVSPPAHDAKWALAATSRPAAHAHDDDPSIRDEILALHAQLSHQAARLEALLLRSTSDASASRRRVARPPRSVPSWGTGVGRKWVARWWTLALWPASHAVAAVTKLVGASPSPSPAAVAPPPAETAAAAASPPAKRTATASAAAVTPVVPSWVLWITLAWLRWVVACCVLPLAAWVFSVRATWWIASHAAKVPQRALAVAWASMAEAAPARRSLPSSSDGAGAGAHRRRRGSVVVPVAATAAKVVVDEDPSPPQPAAVAAGVSEWPLSVVDGLLGLLPLLPSSLPLPRRLLLLGGATREPVAATPTPTSAPVSA